MTIDELKKMLAEAVNSRKTQDEQNLIDLLYCYRQSGDEDRYMVMMDIVSEVTRSRELPDNLDIDNEILLIDILGAASELELLDCNKLLIFALLIAHHRIKYGDLFDKAEMADAIVNLFAKDAFLDILEYAAVNMENDILYNKVFCEGELSREAVTLLMFEMFRAMVPYLKWMKSHYPQFPLSDKAEMFLIIRDDNVDENILPAFPKFDALCRFLYEDLYNEE